MAQVTSQRKISPNLFLLVQSDSIAKLLALIPLFFLGLAVLDSFLNITREDFTTLLVYFVIALVFTAPIILWRHYAIGKRLSEGIEVNANVVNKTFSRRFVELKFAYTREGKPLIRTTKLSSSGKVNKLKPGDNLTLVFDKENPERYLIRELYI